MPTPSGKVPLRRISGVPRTCSACGRGPPRGASRSTHRPSGTCSTKTRELASGAHLDELVITRVDHAGRVQRVVLEGEHRPEISGVQLRALLTARFGPRSIRGTRFSTHRAGARIVFEGQGVGHGVGLCQAGAKARARDGDSPRTILQHYYPGTRLQERPVNPARPSHPRHSLSDSLVHRRRAGR